jgi:hypothetical protein
MTLQEFGFWGLRLTSLALIASALLLMWALRRYHAGSPVARRVALLPGVLALHAAQVAFNFWWVLKPEQVAVSVLAPSVVGWFLVAAVTTYLGLYFIGKVNGTK